MNHNPYNLQIGDRVVLDKREPQLPVKIFAFSPLTQTFAEIGMHESPIDTWQVMTCRLEPLSNYKNETK